ncbi:group II truncated hemoglobin [Desulfosediminicola ganghwensis]|uniref:group II truncated hemoglobin n=1 Tax=Desulfosediminicola ganghwensis TaxID=2569540 RepID=UPI00308464FC
MLAPSPTQQLHGGVMSIGAKHSKTIFQLVGGVEGVRVLCNRFYDIMEKAPEAQLIRDMHPVDLSETRENLTLFLCGWFGGPSLYAEKFGRANLAEIHLFFDIGYRERDLWLACMQKALQQHPIENNLKKKLLERFRTPAEKIRITCQQQVKGLPVLVTSTFK